MREHKALPGVREDGRERPGGLRAARDHGLRSTGRGAVLRRRQLRHTWGRREGPGKEEAVLLSGVVCFGALNPIFNYSEPHIYYLLCINVLSLFYH